METEMSNSKKSSKKRKASTIRRKKKEPNVVYASTQNGMFATKVDSLKFAIDTQLEVDEVDNYKCDIKEMNKIRQEIEQLDDGLMIGVINKDVFKKKNGVTMTIVYMTTPVFIRISAIMEMGSQRQMMGL